MKRKRKKNRKKKVYLVLIAALLVCGAFSVLIFFGRIHKKEIITEQVIPHEQTVAKESLPVDDSDYDEVSKGNVIKGDDGYVTYLAGSERLRNERSANSIEPIMGLFGDYIDTKDGRVFNAPMAEWSILDNVKNKTYGGYVILNTDTIVDGISKPNHFQIAYIDSTTGKMYDLNHASPSRLGKELLFEKIVPYTLTGYKKLK